MQGGDPYPTSCQIRIYTLGPLEIWKHNQGVWSPIEKEAWPNGRRVAQTVLKRLLAAPGRRLSRDSADPVAPETLATSCPIWF